MIVSLQELTLKLEKSDGETVLGRTEQGGVLPVVGARISRVLEIRSVHTCRVVTRGGNWGEKINNYSISRTF